MQLKLLNSSDEAFKQIADVGFNGGLAEQRIQAVKDFAAKEFGSDVNVHVTNEEKGARNKREMTDTTLITFNDSTCRDKALHILESKYSKSTDKSFGIKFEILGTALIAARARTKIKKARNWALRKGIRACEAQGCRRSSRRKHRVRLGHA